MRRHSEPGASGSRFHERLSACSCPASHWTGTCRADRGDRAALQQAPRTGANAVKQETEPLRFGANRLQVQCDPGQLLVLGNCMIDTPSGADVAGVRMFRFGFPPTPEHPDGEPRKLG